MSGSAFRLPDRRKLLIVNIINAVKNATCCRAD